MAVGDLNADGKPDLAVSNYGSANVSVLLGNGFPNTGTFGAPASFAAGSFPISLAIGDLNGDFKPDVVVSNAGSAVTSVLLNTVAQATITMQPTDQAVNQGQSASFSVAAAGATSYRWRRAGVPLTDDDRFSGTATNSLHITGAVPADAGAYDVEILSPPCALAVLSRPVALAVTPSAPLPPSCPASFVTPSFSPAGTYPYAAASADLNGDDLPDVVISNGQSADVSIMLGNGDGSFQPAVQYSAGYRPSAATMADFNGDGFLDLVTANIGGPASLLLGHGDGTFAPASSLGGSGGGGGTGIATGDFNGDGRADLAVTRNDNVVVVLTGSGDGTFSTSSVFHAGNNPLGIAARDLNGDGHLDLVVVNSNGAAVFRGIGNGLFSAWQFAGAGTNPTGVALEDFNGDGIADIAVGNQGSDNISVLRGNGDCTFAPAVNYPCGSWPASLTVCDANGDMRSDLVVANHIPSFATVLLGNGDGTFAAPVSFPEGDRPSGIAAGDFDRDGRSDLVLANYWGNNVSVLLNAGPSIGFSQQPQSQSVAPGANVVFTATATGTGPFTYQWRRNGLPIIGSTSDTLTINNASEINAGSYDVQVRGGCNPAAVATSYPAMLSVGSDCPADFNGFDGLDSQDFFDYLEAFFTGCP